MKETSIFLYILKSLRNVHVNFGLVVPWNTLSSSVYCPFPSTSLNLKSPGATPYFFASSASSCCQTPITSNPHISSKDLPINHLFLISSASFCPTTFPFSSKTSTISPYRWTILFLFKVKLNVELHAKFFVSIFFDVRLSSIPLFSTSPKLDITELNPINSGNVRSIRRSFVLAL